MASAISTSPEGFTAVDRLPLRLMLRRSLAALIWHLGLQKRCGRAPLRWAGAGKAVEQCSQLRVALTGARFLVDRERAPGVVTKSP
jgi:hypothetical protein